MPHHATSPQHARTPLARTIRLLILGSLVAVAQAAIAQTTSAQNSAAPTTMQAAKQYNIAAGPLSQALTQFSSQAGVYLIGASEKAAGKTSRGLNGSYTVDGGFAALLAGSGLEVLRQTDGSYTLRTASGITTLPSMKISANALGASTEGTNSYTTGAMASATKLELSIRETPQSVTVFTRQRMNDQGLTSVSDVLRHTPGFTIEATAPYREEYVSRGFGVSNYLFDGLAAATGDSRAAMLPHDLAVYDRVEITRGAGGMMQGTGSPSATINFVRKRPTREFQSYVQGQVGHWNYLGAEADVSGALNASGSVRGRSVVHWHDADSFMDTVTEGRQLAYLIGEADLTDNTLLTLSFAQQKNDNNTSYGGLPTAPDGTDLELSRSSYYGNKWNYWDDTTTSAFASIEHTFASEWKIKLATNLIWGDQQQLRAGIGLSEEGEWDISGGKADLYNDRATYDLSAQGPFRLFGREHELVVGADMRTAKDGNDTAGYWPLIYFARNVDIYNWHHDAPKPASFTEDYRHDDERKVHGAYFTTRLNITDALKVMLGLRTDSFEYDETTQNRPWSDDDQSYGDWESWTPANYEVDDELTKYAGILYDINQHYTVYTSYTDIFSPQNARTRTNSLVDPIRGKNYEVGIKGEYFSGALNVNAAVFRVDEDDRAIEDGQCPFKEDETCYRAAGTVRSEGYDLEIQGALSRDWQIGAGYTYVSTRIEKDSDAENEGDRINTAMPKRQLKLSSTYHLPGNQWRIGGAVRWQDEIYYSLDAAGVADLGYAYDTHQGSYAVVDAMIGYEHDEHLDVQVNVYNLFDKVYYSSINAQPVEWGGNTVYGDPLNIMVTARYKF